VISKKSAEVIRSHISDAISKGAKDITPDNESFKSPPPDGNFVPPTLLINVNHDMLVMKEETFGPVIPVMKVKNDDEAVRLMNDSEFGLTASIWTKDVIKGTKLAERVEAGTVFVNRCDFPSPVSAKPAAGRTNPVIANGDGGNQDLAWTGWKNSGRGVTLSRLGFEQFVKLKSFHIKDYPR
jgi:acyl-CoA reductase-like NAD-dependent aldehyde dehydrogenase